MIELNQFVMDKRFHSQANAEVKDSICSWSNSRVPFFQKKKKTQKQKPTKTQTKPQTSLRQTKSTPSAQTYLGDSGVNG